MSSSLSSLVWAYGHEVPSWHVGVGAVYVHLSGMLASDWRYF